MFWFLVLIGGFFRTACKASIRFPVQGWLRMQQQNKGVTLNHGSCYYYGLFINNETLNIFLSIITEQFKYPLCRNKCMSKQEDNMIKCCDRGNEWILQNNVNFDTMNRNVDLELKANKCFSISIQSWSPLNNLLRWNAEWDRGFLAGKESHRLEQTHTWLTSPKGIKRSDSWRKEPVQSWGRYPRNVTIRQVWTVPGLLWKTLIPTHSGTDYKIL